VLLGHGEEESRQWFEEQIRIRHPKIKVIQPEPGKNRGGSDLPEA